MKTLLLFLLLSPASIAETKENILKQYKDSALIIFSKKGSGSGFLIKSPFNSNKYIITNAHVCEMAVNNMLKVATNSTSSIVLNARVLKVDKNKDLCALSPRFTSNKIPSFSLGSKIGDTVFLIGHPRGRYVTITQGELFGFTVAYNNTVWTSSAYAEPGSSGSMALDEDGKLIGIIFAVYTSNAVNACPNSKSLIIPSSDVYTFLGDL